MTIKINLNMNCGDYLKKKLEQSLIPYEGQQDTENINGLMSNLIKNITIRIMKRFNIQSKPHCIIKVLTENLVIKKTTIEFKDLPNEWLKCCEY